MNRPGAIIVASFGTTYAETRKKTIGAIEEEIRKAFPDCAVRRAFTSNIVRRILRERDGIVVDSVPEALERAAADGVSDAVIVPTLLMDGHEFDKIREAVLACRTLFIRLDVTAPLLTSEEDMDAVCDVIRAEYPLAEGEAALFMGHGTDAASNRVYAALARKLSENAETAGRYFIATVEGTPELPDVLPEIRKGGFRRVRIAPLMVVAGDHANNDLAGEDGDSWKSILLAEGFEVIPDLRGLGELPGIRALYLRHLKDLTR